MKNFITNSGADNLKNRLSELISKSDELKFLVGFFYFSGLKELYESLIQNHDVVLKILVGLNVDTLNYELIEYSDKEDRRGSLSNEDIYKKFLYSLKKSINTDNFDTKDFYNQSRFFVDLIKKGRLILRKTIRPNHAKLYIFKLQSSQVGCQNLFITGSSNLTKLGLSDQEEFNVEISDYGVDDVEQYFENLWNDSIKITEDNELRTKIIEILEKETLIKRIIPFEAYVLVLKTYLDSFERKEIGSSLSKILEKNDYTPYQYQLDAVEQALAIIEKNNGVILADVVGLGKTVIACAIARQLGKRGVIICPPGIKGDKNKKDAGWEMYKEQFELYDWEVWSLGDLDKLQDQITHEQLKDIGVVIVDEAHRFRNQDTRAYEYLKNICRGKIVILLTATPFNNRPADILSLLKLFITPKQSNITLENNLVDKFRSFKGIFDRLAYIEKYYKSEDQFKRNKAYNEYKAMFGEEFNLPKSLQKVKNHSKYLAKQIRDVIEPVIIRRNRLDILNHPEYKKEVQNLSKVADPQEWFFELTKEQSEFYDEIIKKYFANPEEGGQFKGAIYRPFEYETEKEKIKEKKLSDKENFEFLQQRNLYDFMRRLLVKRFESSFGAFRQSIENFKKVTEDVNDFVRKMNKYILDRDLVEQIYTKEPEEIESYLKDYVKKIKEGVYPKNYKIYDLSKFKYENEFLRDIESDKNLFDKILKSLDELKLSDSKNDAKTKSLVNHLKSQLKKEPQRKIVIFSEYRDTVKYLKDILDREFPDKVLSIVDNLSQKTIEEINKNFDASYLKEKQEDKYKILLASDRISEGFNLNRAGMVINYDIPWNPVRVIQRVGRINRISKKVFDELYIVNFFPTEKGAELVRSREIASNKMFLIHSTLGEDAKIFDIDEEPSASKLYEKIQQNPEKMEEESFYTKIYKEFNEIKKQYPELIKSLDKFPLRVKVAKKYSEDELLVFIKKGRLYIYSAKIDESLKPNYLPVDFEDAIDEARCNYNESPVELSNNFWDLYEGIKNFKEGKSQMSLPENSIEQKAKNNLNTLKELQNDKISTYKTFLTMLLEDIVDYGTLPDYTLRRIADLESENEDKLAKSIKEIEALKKELGENYLDKEKERQKNLNKEIIVAIENQKL
ncbi:MAG: helicase-related protein [Candidatus Pacebacteria bacterium]|nr:helicase-related protein [Candidatus Paceibacterota bacterium]